MLIFEGNSIEYEIEVIDSLNQIVRVKDKRSKIIFEGVATSVEINREYPAYAGTFMAMKVVSDVRVEMIKVLRVKS